jgi:large subunit ribosomal protein L37Ae
MAKKTSSSTKRYGTRYGKTVKDKAAKIEKQQRSKYVCPSCSREQVKRVALGIWECNKCGAKFANKAYTIGKPIKIQTSVTKL